MWLSMSLLAQDYDFYADAYEISDINNWQSVDAEFTTIGATADGVKASCWNTNADYTRWFKFQATTNMVNVTVKRGGGLGTIRRINVALWQADGINEISCNRYINNYDNVTVGSANLIIGNWYYISVDNNYRAYRGSFTLAVNNQVDYDYYEGAYEISDINNWQSVDAEFTTIGATADGVKASCWNTNADYTRWFKFQAVTNMVNVTVKRGGGLGTIRRINVALWQADGTSELTCNRYTGNNDNVTLGNTNLIVGNWYYISVDNNYGAYRGSFSLAVNNQVDYDYYEGAYEIPDISDWQSVDGEFTTKGATADGIKASCWNTNADYTRWFKFQATTSAVNIEVRRGGTLGTIRRINAAIWEADGTTEVSCKRYFGNNDNVSVGSVNLVPGNWYYLSVDNNNSGYRGSFSLYADDQADYDFYEGAIEITNISDWCSADAEYTTIGASSDRLAGSCCNTSPNYNRWFKFTATTNTINVTVKCGGSLGTIRRINAVLWEGDGVTEVSCNRYVSTRDNVIVGSTILIPGNEYYISVDNNYSGYRGSFTLCVDNHLDYDYYGGAKDVTDLINSCSADAEFTTVGATSDGLAGSCWNTSPNYNRWFKFTATTNMINLTVKRGGVFGTIRRINAALWEADGTTEVSCNRYVNMNDNVSVGSIDLVPGNEYYFSVDNNYSGYRGTFTLCIEDQLDYDFFEGAKDITNLINSCSNDAEYTTVGATPDKLAAPCWNTSPNYNRWFKFLAVKPAINIELKRGGSYGTIRRANIALFDSDGLTVLDCNRYVNTNDNVEVDFEGLAVGQWYYISVDNNYSGYRGTFTLCLDDNVSYDYYEGAKELGIIHNWISEDAAYTTIGATPDRNAASCWNTSPNYNRWFKFTATTNQIHFEVKRGGNYGTLRRINAAIWQADGLTGVSCNRYINTNDNVVVESIDLIPGNTYYASVDNNYSGYRGTFSLFVNDEVDYDFYEGAKDVTYLINSSSDLEAYTTMGATADKNAASCWNTSPNYNRWFKFQATSPGISVNVKCGGIYGTIRRINIALWEADGTTELSCDRYINTNDDVDLSHEGLTIGNWYYISVDNNYSGYRGTFTLEMNDDVGYDYYEGAIELVDINNWESAPAKYSTLGATSDKVAASCWNTSPNYNRWFKFVATTPVVNVEVKRGGIYGTVRRVNAAIWKDDGLTSVACNRYINNHDNVKLGSNALIPGETYYISVDNNYSGYRGSFTLAVNDEVDYDFYEGAYELTDLNNWQSDDAQFTTLGATQDKNAASCWNTSPNYNRWFKFQALSADVTIEVLRGGTLGTVRRLNAALWEADGTTEIACERYSGNNNSLSISQAGLTVGNWYYISVDNNYSGYRGTFSLAVNNVSGTEYYAIANGDWSDTNTWSNTEGGPPAGTIPGAANLVHIGGYTVITTSNSACAYLDIDVKNSATGLIVDGANLDVKGALSFVNSGNNVDASILVSNGGSLMVNADLEMNRIGGNNSFTIDIQGNSTLEIGNDLKLNSSSGAFFETQINLASSAVLSVERDIQFSSTGGSKIKITAGNSAVIQAKRDVIYSANTAGMLEIELVNNASLEMGRSFVRGTTPYGILNCQNNSTVLFNGTDYIQKIAGNSGAGGDDFIYQNLTVNNTRISVPQLSLDGDVVVNKQLNLISGVIHTESGKTLTLANTSSLIEASANSYVEGPMEKIGNTAFTFPIGKDGLYQPITISAPSLSTDAFKAEYFAQDPDGTYSRLLKDPAIDNVSGCEYWMIERTSGSSNVRPTLLWDGDACCISDLSTLRVITWNGTQWIDLGNASTTGNSANGTIQPSGSISNTSNPLTFGNPLPATDFSGLSGPYCTDEAPVLLNGSPLDGNGVFSGPGITDNGNGTATFSPLMAGGGTHTIVYTYTTSLSGCSGSTSKEVVVNSDPAGSVTGTATICADELTDISLFFTGVAPWSVSYTDGTNSYSITTSSNPYVFSTNIPGTYEITSLVDAEGCVGSNFGNTAVITNHDKPVKAEISVVTGFTTFCEGESVTLESTASDYYYWSDGVTAQQNIITESGSYTVQTYNTYGCLSEVSDPINITVNQVPEPSLIGTSSYCIGSGNSEYLTEAGMDNYQWAVAAGGTIVSGGTATDNTVSILWNTVGSKTVSVNYENVLNCAATSPTVFDVDVGVLPSVTFSCSDLDNEICFGETVIFTAGGGDEYEFYVNSFIVQAQSSTSSYTTSGLSDGDDVSVKVVNTSSGCYDEQYILITVNTPSAPAATIAVANNGSCSGIVKTLTPVGGSLGIGAGWKWYSDASCTNLLHTGFSFDVDPSVDTQYWLRAEGSCNTTAAVDKSVIVAAPPQPKGIYHE